MQLGCRDVDLNIDRDVVRVDRRDGRFSAIRLRAIGNVIHCGRQMATAEARIVGPDGKLYAHGTTTCLVFETPAG